MNLNEWFEVGMDPDNYIESMDKNKEGLLHIYDSFVPPANKTFFDKLSARSLRVIVLTEDWCGDAMLNVPILLRIAEKADMPVRMVLRDENLELMDQYLTNGKSRSIPIFVFIDENGTEVAKWGPRAPEIQQFVDESRDQLPSKDAEDFKEKSQEVHLFMRKSFQENSDFWNNIYNSLKNTLEKEL